MKFSENITDLFTVASSKTISSLIIGIFYLFLAGFLSKEGYGELAFFIAIASVAQALSLLGVNQIIVVYTSKEKGVISSAYSLGILSGTITSIIIYFISGEVVVSLFVLTTTMFFLMTSHFNGQKKFKLYALAQLSQKLILIILVLILYPILGITGILLGFALSYLVSIGDFLKFLKNKNFTFTGLRTKTKFMLGNYFSNLNWFLLWFGDKILIGSIFSFTILGTYQLASQYILLLYNIPLSLSLYLIPNESRGISNKKIKIYSIILSVIRFFLPFLFFKIIIVIIGKRITGNDMKANFKKIINPKEEPITLVFTKLCSLKKKKYNEVIKSNPQISPG